jgi:hypothetical protein
MSEGWSGDQGWKSSDKILTISARSENVPLLNRRFNHPHREVEFVDRQTSAYSRQQITQKSASPWPPIIKLAITMPSIFGLQGLQNQASSPGQLNKFFQ